MNSIPIGTLATGMLATVILGGFLPGGFASAQTSPQATSAPRADATIKALQEALNKQGIAVKADGVLDAETRAAIRTYQSQHHLPVTGEPDNATLDKLGIVDKRAGAPPETQAAGQATQGAATDMQGMGMMGAGIMGPGMMGAGMMGPGMGGASSPMQQGIMPCPMMGGMMPTAGGMGPQAIRQGIGPSVIYGVPRVGGAELSEEDVKSILQGALAWHGNPRLKAGRVHSADSGEVLAEILTQDGSLVQHLAFDRRTGAIRQVD